MHECGDYHDALCSLTNTLHITSDQHVEIGTTRMKRDYTDLMKVVEWLKRASHNPFDANRPHLQALDTGLMADETVNCDDAEAVGHRLQVKLDGVSLNDATVKRKEQAVTLVTLKPTIKIGDEEVIVDPMVLFSRFLILFQRYNEIETFFAYELAPCPMSLFNNQNMMRKPSKSSLGKHLVDRFNKSTTHEDSSTSNDNALCNDDDSESDEASERFSDSDDELFTAFDGNIFDNLQSTSSTDQSSSLNKYVIYGGYLLHRIIWSKTATYGEIINQYKSYVRSHYGDACTVVFDGYAAGVPSNEDHEHRRKLLKAKIAPIISIQLDSSGNKFTQKAFLSNSVNKQNFINLLGVALESDGHTILRSDGDADTMIVSSVLDHACTGSDVTLVAADTDLFVMLLYFWNNCMGTIVMKSEATKEHGATERDVGKISECLGEISKYLTFIHAFGGCDTTSAVFGQGKLSILRLLEKRDDARKLADVFLNKDSTQDQICNAGLKLFVMLYGGKESDTITRLRYLKYLNMASSPKISPERLPPSERAAYHHVLRVFCQVQEWNCLEENAVNPENWGWKVVDGKLEPIMTDEPPAPDELLKVIRCKCQTTSKHPCGVGTKCSCRSNGLKCVDACGNCRGTECENINKEHVLVENKGADDAFDDNIFENLFGV